MRALKSSLFATAGGKEHNIRPKTILAGQSQDADQHNSGVWEDMKKDLELEEEAEAVAKRRRGRRGKKKQAADPCGGKVRRAERFIWLRRPVRVALAVRWRR